MEQNENFFDFLSRNNLNRRDISLLEVDQGISVESQHKNNNDNANINMNMNNNINSSPNDETLNYSYDDNLYNLQRIEKIENMMQVINGNFQFLTEEIKSLKNSIKNKRPNLIKRKLQEKSKENLTSEAILKEIESLKLKKLDAQSQDERIGSKSTNDNKASESKKRLFKNKTNGLETEDIETNKYRQSLLKIKSFKDLNIDLESLKAKSSEDINNSNSNNINKHTGKAHQSKDSTKADNDKQIDINEILEGFKKKQDSESVGLNKKKFRSQQVSLSEKEDVNY